MCKSLFNAGQTCHAGLLLTVIQEGVWTKTNTQQARCQKTEDNLNKDIHIQEYMMMSFNVGFCSTSTGFFKVGNIVKIDKPLCTCGICTICFIVVNKKKHKAECIYPKLNLVCSERKPYVGVKKVNSATKCEFKDLNHRLRLHHAPTLALQQQWS